MGHHSEAFIVPALMAMRGIDLVAAVTILAEIGDLSRQPRTNKRTCGIQPAHQSLITDVFGSRLRLCTIHHSAGRHSGKCGVDNPRAGCLTLDIRVFPVCQMIPKPLQISQCAGMRRDDICLYVSPASRLRLEAITKDRNSARKTVWRAEIVLATAAGAGTNEIMRATGKSKPCVWRWQARYLDEGVDGLLRDKTRRSRVPALAEKVKLAVLTKTAKETDRPCAP